MWEEVFFGWWWKFFPHLDKARIGRWWKFFSLPWQGKDCPKTGSKGKEDLGGGGNPHLKKIQHSCDKRESFLLFSLDKSESAFNLPLKCFSRVDYWCLFCGGDRWVLASWSWSCGQWWILVCSSGHWASVTSFSEAHRSLADRFLFNLLQNTSLQDWLFICFNCNELHTFLFAQTIFGSPPWYIFYFS